MKKKIFAIIMISILVAAASGFVYVYIEKSRQVAVAAVKEQPSEAVRQPAASETAVNNKVEETTKVEEKKEPLTIVAVGDILLGRGVGMRLDMQKKGYIYPFEKVVGFLREGDVIFGNLEESITDRTHSLTGINEGGKYVLKNDLKAFEGIKYAGFNLLNLANNHILDYYQEGLSDTTDLLDKNGIAHAGAGKNLDEARKPAIMEKKGKKIGMLSYTDMSEIVYKGNPQISFVAHKDRYGVAPTQYEYMKEDVDRLRGSVDILIVSLHWGKEESFDILPGQVEMAHKLIDEGADIVLGHHPHQFQGMEIYKGKPIIYSMGNFIFDQNDPENQETFILNLKYLDNKLTGFTALPARTIEKTQIVPVNGANAAGLLARELQLCQKLDSKCHVENDKIVFDLE